MRNACKLIGKCAALGAAITEGALGAAPDATFTVIIGLNQKRIISFLRELRGLRGLRGLRELRGLRSWPAMFFSGDCVHQKWILIFRHGWRGT